MSVRERIRRYRTTGAAADLVRVEILVPADGRERVLALARELREEHRRARAIRSVNAEAVNDRAKLIIHRLVARRMGSDRGIIDRAREAVSRVRLAGGQYEYLGEWQDLLSRHPTELRRIITIRTERMYRLRISSPFALLADVKDPELRRRIWRKARKGLASRGG